MSNTYPSVDLSYDDMDNVGGLLESGNNDSSTYNTFGGEDRSEPPSSPIMKPHGYRDRADSDVSILDSEYGQSANPEPSSSCQVRHNIRRSIRRLYYRFAGSLYKRPFLYLLISFLLTAGLSFGFNSIEIQTLPSDLFLTADDPVLEAKEYVENHFDRQRQEFVIFTDHKGGNIIDKEHLYSLLDIHYEVLDLKVDVDGQKMGFTDFCLKINGVCDVLSVLHNWNFNKTLIEEDPDIRQKITFDLLQKFLVGGVTLEGFLVNEAIAFKAYYILDDSNVRREEHPGWEDGLKEWESKFLKMTKHVKKPLKAVFKAEKSDLDVVLAEGEGDTWALIGGVVLFTLLIMYHYHSHRRTNSRAIVSIGALVSVIASAAASIGLLVLTGEKFNLSDSSAVLFLLIVGFHHVSLFVANFEGLLFAEDLQHYQMQEDEVNDPTVSDHGGEDPDVHDTVEKAFRRALALTAPTLLLYMLSISISGLIISAWPGVLPGFRSFCSMLAWNALLEHIFFMTIFCSLFALHCRRVQSNAEEDVVVKHQPFVSLRYSYRILNWFYKETLMNNYLKICVIVLCFGGLALGIHGCVTWSNHFADKDLFSKDSYMHKYYDLDQEYFQGQTLQPIDVVFRDGADWTAVDTGKALQFAADAIKADKWTYFSLITSNWYETFLQSVESYHTKFNITLIQEEYPPPETFYDPFFDIYFHNATIGDRQNFRMTKNNEIFASKFTSVAYPMHTVYKRAEAVEAFSALADKISEQGVKTYCYNKAFYAFKTYITVHFWILFVLVCSLIVISVLTFILMDAYSALIIAVTLTLIVIDVIGIFMHYRNYSLYAGAFSVICVAPALALDAVLHIVFRLDVNRTIGMGCCSFGVEDHPRISESKRVRYIARVRHIMSELGHSLLYITMCSIVVLSVMAGIVKSPSTIEFAQLTLVFHAVASFHALMFVPFVTTLLRC